MLPDRVSNPGPLTYESGALPIALRGPAIYISGRRNESMLPDRISNPGPLTYESGALPIALRGPAANRKIRTDHLRKPRVLYVCFFPFVFASQGYFVHFVPFVLASKGYCAIRQDFSF